MHDQFAALATRLIAKNGRAVQLISYTNSGKNYDPVYVENPTNAMAVQTLFSASDADIWRIETHDKAFLLDAAINLSVGMRLRDNGMDYSIVDMQIIQPGETVCLYKVQVRA